MQNELLESENSQTQENASVENAEGVTQSTPENQSSKPAAENNTQNNDTQTPSAEGPKSQKNQKSRKNVFLASCAKFIFIGKENMNFKDLHGKTYELVTGDEIIVPKGSMEVHMNARKTLFKRV